METELGSDTLPGQSYESAPTYTVPNERVVSVEHPCIIKNVDKGLKSLGGEHQINTLLERHIGDDPENQREKLRIGAKLRPDDPFSNQLLSTAVQTRNILVKVTIPKRTGRRRKRGSDEAFSYPSQDEGGNAPTTAEDLLQRLRDNPQSYTITPVGLVNETHRFRSLPDFQLRGGDLPIMNEINRSIFPATLDSVKKFRIDMNPGSEGITAFPAPPAYIDHKMPKQPNTYEYKQAGGVRLVVGQNGELTSFNSQSARKRQSFVQDADVDAVPQMGAPVPNPKSQQGKQIKKAVERLNLLLDERPLVTTRVAMNAIPEYGEGVFKEATQYVGYSFKSGPWRDALIKFGVDPRKDPKHRFYQTLMFQLSDKMRAAGDQAVAGSGNRWLRTERHRPDQIQSHIFDGRSVTPNGKTWQICDITDPILRDLLETSDIRTECDIGSPNGWFHNGTIAKVRVIMRDKIGEMLAGRDPDDNIYKLIANMPNKIDDRTTQGAYFDRDQVSRRVLGMAVDVRVMARHSINTKKGRGLQNGPLKVPMRRAHGADADEGESCERDGDENEGEDDELEDDRGEFAFVEDLQASQLEVENEAD